MANEERTWWTKHVDTAIILGAVVSSILWMNAKFNDIDGRFAQMNEKFSKLEQDIAVIKAVMVLKNILPPELCKTNDKAIEENK